MVNTLPYLFWLIVFVFIPSVLLWAIFWRYFIKYKLVFIVITIGAVLWGLSFDIVGSTIWGVWSYSSTIGVYILGLPIEEYLILLFLPQNLVSILLLLRRKIYG